jgi:hypothetical protein
MCLFVHTYIYFYMHTFKYINIINNFKSIHLKLVFLFIIICIHLFLKAYAFQ